ncbi:hypothetical protein [Halosegnis marinus]|uniref:DUF4175 domain-containing protein n=1 Tax=Halosegnis marinus TaxID=3034023 RepID=A0ABD5ZLJ8_9EURY|nr:hypothetical protein [Halosegnis sp. DT85]
MTATLDRLPSWAKAVSVLATAVVLAGVGDFLLSQAGYTGLGALVWALGYGGAVVAVWAIWFRGQEFDPD